MGSGSIQRSARQMAIGAGLGLLLGGCASVGTLLGSKAGDSASSAASNAGTIADAVDWVTGPSDSYCRKGTAPDPADQSGGEGLVPVYKVTAGDCATGDSELKEYEYNEIVAQNEARAWANLHTAARAEAAKPTYCRTAAAHIVYRASSKTCQPGEDTITEEEYTAAKAEAAAAAAKLP